ncbi:Sas10 C-terminal domain-containing protein [Aspergillus pseudoustus]|uniref:Sas10 C-terminal domain-containing protein n=1 Tax=Aspergillus pseudoustus TaxID=1810923 RepID=A0ABR4J765_9EURO
MGKKRKAGGRPAANKAAEEEKYKFDIEERFDDSADEFQTGRDQILLEEAPDAKRRRKLVEEEEALQPSDEEILGYESYDEEPEDDDDMEEDDEDDLEQSQPKKRGGSPGSGEEDEEGIAGWGSSRKDFYNADQIETEADALEEEEEARRLQQKQLQDINEEDFGFDEEEWAESGKGPEEAKDETGEVTEVLPQLEITDDMSTEEKLKILKSRYPEFEPLAKDFVGLQPTHETLSKAAKAAKQNNDTEAERDHAPIIVVKYRALSAYLGAISMYFMLLTSGSESPDNSSTISPAQLRSHPVMTSLVNFRKLWEAVKDITPVEVNPRKKASEQVESNMDIDIPEVTTTESKKAKASKKDKKERKPTRAERAAEAARVEAEARRAKRLEETEANLAGLSNLVTALGRKRVVQKARGPAKDADDSDFGDEDALTAKEAEEKAKQKRSLRFYTSQIAQKSNKRSAAGRDAGGDADIPYRERLKDRQARLNAEAERRGRQKPEGAEELGGDSDEEDNRVRKELRGNASGSDDEDYYDMVAARTNKRKGDKKALSEAYAAAAREGGHVEVQEEIGPDGKRAITYQIEKNRGLAPKRNKLNRNPRVKKRMRFESKKKKLGSVRQVYKGGEGAGGYGGELTGIKKNLVKSVKL